MDMVNSIVSKVCESLEQISLLDLRLFFHDQILCFSSSQRISQLYYSIMMARQVDGISLNGQDKPFISV